MENREQTLAARVRELNKGQETALERLTNLRDRTLTQPPRAAPSDARLSGGEAVEVTPSLENSISAGHSILSQIHDVIAELERIA